MGLTANPYIGFFSGTVTAGGTDGAPISETYQTALTASNLANDTVITVADITGFIAGMDIVVGNEVKTIQSISGMQITLTTGLGSAHSTGDTVKNVGSETAPFVVSINGTETAVQTAAIRAKNYLDVNYQAAAGGVIAVAGANAARIALSLDGVTFTTYGSPITLPNVVDTTNTLFYYKAKPLPRDTPQPDFAVGFKFTGSIRAV